MGFRRCLVGFAEVVGVVGLLGHASSSPLGAKRVVPGCYRVRDAVMPAQRACGNDTGVLSSGAYRQAYKSVAALAAVVGRGEKYGILGPLAMV